jgi:hypothetical protein
MTESVEIVAQSARWSRPRARTCRRRSTRSRSRRCRSTAATS